MGEKAATLVDKLKPACYPVVMHYKDDWRALALCRQFDPEIWFESSTSAKKICNQCHVKDECLEDALSFPLYQDRYGIRGGLTPAERYVLRERRRINNTVIN